MPDGTRKRRFSENQCRRRWYARHRAIRFQRRFGLASAELKVARRGASPSQSSAAVLGGPQR